MQTLSKSERLGNFRLQKMLFSQGNSFFCHPFRVVYLVLKPDELSADTFGLFQYPVKTIFPVPARNIRKATARNRVRRLVKESFRKNKSGLYSFLNNRHEICLLALVYSIRQILPYREMESKIRLSLQRLEEAIQNNGGKSGDPANSQ
jgi:ribonuclease P protein component